MSRYYSADDTITTLASGLDLIDFKLSEQDHERFQELRRAGTLINVSLYPHGQTYRVRLYLGGKLRVIGIGKKGPEAARFADIAKLFFWPYRMRGIRLPENFDFNYGLEKTRYALEHPVDADDEAIRLLEKIRDHLISTAELHVNSASANGELANQRAVKEKRKTVSGELRLLLTERAAEIVAMANSVSALQQAVTASVTANAQYFEQLKLAFAHIRDRLDSLEKKD